MGKKSAKQRRQTAIAQSNGSLPAEDTVPTATMPSTPSTSPQATHIMPRKTARNADPLTGEWLRPDTIKIAWADVDTSRPEGARKAPPMRLHRIQAEFSGDSVERLKNAPKGCVWTGETEAYFAPVLPTVIQREKQGWLQWWDNSYVLGRLYVRMGKPAVDASIAIWRDQHDTVAVAARFQHSVEWVRRMAARAVKLAAEYYRFHRHQAARMASV